MRNEINEEVGRGWLVGWDSKDPEKRKRTIAGYLHVSYSTAKKWHLQYSMPLRAFKNRQVTVDKNGRIIKKICFKPKALPEEMDLWLIEFDKLRLEESGRDYFPARSIKNHLEDKEEN